MTEELESILSDLINVSSAARNSYFNAIQAVKTGEGDPDVLVREGDGYFEQARRLHHDTLTLEGCGEDFRITIFMVHVEDLMMCAETFRILAQEFIEIYRRLK